MSCTCRMDTLNAIIRAEERTSETIGKIILLLTNVGAGDRHLPARGELIKMIRKLTGFYLEFCPLCQQWFPPKQIVLRSCGYGLGRSNRCTVCLKEEKRKRNRQYWAKRKKRRQQADSAGRSL